ncbi:MAG TPA: alkyl sulfatase dimerization domain-containing protein [Acidimicrobiales bacterium]|nr:alkyl sulfatase dimerization domain-containing protein [Acidimicrobiales bacterium]
MQHPGTDWITDAPDDGTGDVERAARGFVAGHPTGVIERDGRPIWDTGRYDFLRDSPTAPDSVHPSLWRQARLNCVHGLFEVQAPDADGRGGVWQARGYDLSNITFIAGDTGWIVIDPLTAAETAAAGLALANEHLGERPVVAVIYTHSHIDHFGGVEGVTSAEDVAAGRCQVLAPAGFLQEAVSENVIAGPAMVRRAMYMYGPLLPVGPEGQVDAGLGKATPLGTVGLIPPTEEIHETGAERVIDGVRIVFQLTPGTEAPAEMNFHFPDLRLLCMAENCTHTMHNLYTLRGAQVRDSLAWSRYINESIDLFADVTDTCFASHHWPRFGADDVRAFLVQQRDLYRWLHDQTMRLANHGLTAAEIAEQLDRESFADLDDLAGEHHVRGYYGTVNHNVKAVYQRYLGWFDGNPANLHPLPPVETATRTVEWMGGPDAVLDKARELLAAAAEHEDLRWLAQVLNQVVFAAPDRADARELQAEVLQRLGFASESAPWRNFYLTGAQELRNGTFDLGDASLGGFAPGMTTSMLFDALGVRLRPEALAGFGCTIEWTLTDRDEVHTVGISNRTLFHSPDRPAPDADARVTTTAPVLVSLIDGALDVEAATADGSLTVEGDTGALTTIAGAVDTFARIFPIVTP